MKTKTQLIREVELLQKRIQELETAGGLPQHGHQTSSKAEAKLASLTRLPRKTFDKAPVSSSGPGIEAAEQKRAALQIEYLNRLKEVLLNPSIITAKLKQITDAVVETFWADFCRIWITRPGDHCNSGCIHAEAAEGPHLCRSRDQCLHLVASSGRYTHINGEMHRRVPFGCYKIGRIIAEKDSKFITNDVTKDPQIHDHDWAKRLDLVSFAGYRLLSEARKPIGVLALFCKQTIAREEDAILEDIANTTAQVIQRAKVEENVKNELDHLEKLSKERSIELEKKNVELERFNNLFVGREFRIKELRDKVKELESNLKS